MGGIIEGNTRSSDCSSYMLKAGAQLDLRAPGVKTKSGLS